MVCCVQDFIRQSERVSGALESLDEFVEQSCMLAGSHTSHILHHECARPEFINKPQEMKDEVVSRIIQNAMADERESLTRRATYQYIDLSIIKVGGIPDAFSSKFPNIRADNGGVWKVVLVNGRVDWIEFDGDCNIESGLFESER